ncbi:hypothetical protein ZIOFF_019599 [Zingiber officinale]|uniref:Uncharacterized protein n=1 Tax=Zingiber officinale TaxID=94328 RepID=A0A8J5H7M1_ZINOF|nr:hypothetical protein ZIOFF_019599 [Zingiber officinale]
MVLAAEEFFHEEEVEHPVRYLSLDRVYSYSVPCVNPSGSSSVTSKKVKARMTGKSTGGGRGGGYIRDITPPAHIPEIAETIAPLHEIADLAPRVFSATPTEHLTAAQAWAELGNPVALHLLLLSKLVHATGKGMLEIEGVDLHALIGLECKASNSHDYDDWYKGSITEYNSDTKHHRVCLELGELVWAKLIGSVIHRFYRYPSESALSPEPPVSFTAPVGFSVANIRNGFEPGKALGLLSAFKRGSTRGEKGKRGKGEGGGVARGGKRRGFAGFARFATTSPLLRPSSPTTAPAVGCRPFSPPHDSAARLLLLLTRVPWILHAIAAAAGSISSLSLPVVTAGDSCGYRLRAIAIAVSTLCLHPQALRPAGFTASAAAFILFSSHISPLRPAVLAASPPRPVATATLGRRPHRWPTYGFHDSCCALRVGKALGLLSAFKRWSTRGEKGKGGPGGKRRGFDGLAGFVRFATTSPLLPPSSPTTAPAVGCRPFSPPHDSAARLLLLLTRVPWILHAIAAAAGSISSSSLPVVTAGDSCGYRLGAIAIAVSTLCLHPHALRPAGFTASAAAFILFSSHISPLRPAVLAASPPRPVATATLERRPHRWPTYGFHDSITSSTTRTVTRSRPLPVTRARAYTSPFSPTATASAAAAATASFPIPSGASSSSALTVS